MALYGRLNEWDGVLDANVVEADMDRSCPETPLLLTKEAGKPAPHREVDHLQLLWLPNRAQQNESLPYFEGRGEASIQDISVGTWAEAMGTL